MYDVNSADEVDDSEMPDRIGRALHLVDSQAALLVEVSTGGRRINDVNRTYVKQRLALRSLLRGLGLTDPFPYADLWEWYGHYSQHLSRYAQRREHVSSLARDVRDLLQRMLGGTQVHDPGAPEGLAWSALDARVSGVAEELRTSSTKDDLQDVGRRCREILIDAAQLLAEPALVPAGQQPPKAADAKAWLDLFLRATAAGRSHAELRAFVPSAWDLAQKVTHGDIDHVDAFAAAQATVLLVRTLQMLASTR